MGFGVLRNYYKIIGKSYYVRFPIRHLLLNFIVQRIFGINKEVPYSVYFTNKITGWKNCRFEDEIALANLCGSGGAYIAAFDGTTLSVGAGTIWACNICIQTANHIPGKLTEYDLKSVSIGRNCWLGNSVTILPGVQLGDNVVVGANSVVTKSFQSNVIIAGVPAKIIKELK